MSGHDLTLLQMSNGPNDEKLHHEDVIHDVQFNWDGTLIATCSSDHQIMVWEQDSRGKWRTTKDHIIQAHESPIWRLSWAHPNYGTVLASCSYDHKVMIWERNYTNRWDLVSTLTDSKTSITDVKFCPRSYVSDSEEHTGFSEPLRLAASSDDHVWFYQSRDEVDMTQWTPSNDPIKLSKGRINCISWCDARHSNLLLAISVCCGYDSKVELFSYDDNAWIRCHELATEYNISHICFGPGNGSPENFLAVATDKDLQVWKLIVNMDLEVDDDDYTPLMNLSPSKQEVGSGQDQIKHVTWDIFGQEIITLSDQNGAKSWTWSYQKKKWVGEEILSGKSLSRRTDSTSRSSGLTFSGTSLTQLPRLDGLTPYCREDHGLGH